MVADDALPVVGFEANEDTGSWAFALAWNPCRASLAQIRRLPICPYLKADARLNIQSTPAGRMASSPILPTYPYLILSYRITVMSKPQARYPGHSATFQSMSNNDTSRTCLQPRHSTL